MLWPLMSVMAFLQFNGVYISWLRYAEWLLTCPVSG